MYNSSILINIKKGVVYIFFNTLVEKCQNLLPLMDSNIYIHSNQSHETRRFSKVSIPPFMRSYLETFIEKKLTEKETIDEEAIVNNQVYYFEDPFKMGYLTCPIEDDKKDQYTVTLGPLLSRRLTREEVRYIGFKRGLSTDNCFILETFYQLVPLYETLEVIRLATLLLDYLPAPLHLPQIIRESHPKDHLKSLPELTQDFSDYDFAKHNYAVEEVYLKAVERGDLGYIDRLEAGPDMGVSIPKRFPNNPLRESKNLAITLNSISVRAALRGGLEEGVAHSLSHAFGIRIEKQISVEALNRLNTEMMVTYIQAVYKYSLESYSPLVRQGITYIRHHLLEKIGLADLAQELHVSKEHLARQFKKELGQTVSQYIQAMKVDESKDLLKNKGYSVSEIGYSFGFSSPAHYSKAFKKVTGKSPKEWVKED